MRLKLLLMHLGLKLFFISSYFGEWGKKSVIYRIGKKAKFNLRVNTSDKLNVFQVWKSKEYFDSEFRIEKDDIIVDIGANIGAFSVYAAKKADKGTVFSYEPDKENYSMLLKNKFLNDADNIFPFNQAISAKKCTIDFFVAKLNAAGHSIYKTDSGKKIKVESISLKDIITTNNILKINYLKIDAEGAEYDILMNTSPEIMRKIDKIVLEYHDYLGTNYNHIDLKRFLKNNGFKVNVCGNIFLSFVGRIFGVGMIKAKRKAS